MLSVRLTLIVHVLFISMRQSLHAQEPVGKDGGIIDRGTQQKEISWCAQECYYKLTTGDSIVRVSNDSIVAVYSKVGAKWSTRHPNGIIAEVGKFRRYKGSIFHARKYIRDYHVKVGKWRKYDQNGRLVLEE